MIVNRTQSKTMDRLNSWNSIKQTFSPYSRTDTVKILSKRRTNRSKRKTASFSIQKYTSTRCKNDENSIIEDSDEENDKTNNVIDVSLLQPKLKKSKFVPLNTAGTMCSPHQTTIEIIASDSEEVIPASGNDSKKIVNTNCLRKQNESNFSLFGAKQNDLNVIRNVFNGTRVANEQMALEDSIIDTDTEDDDDDGTTQRPAHVTTIAMPLNVMHLNAMKTEPSSEPIIDSASSFGSFQCQSQQTQIPLIQKTQKRQKVMRGGLADMLQRSIRKSKSNYAFWQNERQSTLAAPGERVLIEKIERSYGRILVHCTQLDDNGSGDVKIFCLDPESKKLPFLSIGKTIEVEFDINGYRLDSHTLCYSNVNNILLN